MNGHARLPGIKTRPNQYDGCEIRIDAPKFISISPKSGKPHIGSILLEYVPDELYVDIGSYGDYLLAYRNLDIFFENVGNRILDDVIRVARPRRAVVTGTFTAQRDQGELRSTIITRYPRKTVISKQANTSDAAHPR